MDQIPMKNQAPRQHNPQSGSIFIWLFVMVALFGALSYAMLQGSRTGASTMTAEQAKLAATEILEYQELIARTVKEMRINGIPLEQLDFQTDNLYRIDGTPLGVAQDSDYCTTNACKIFDPEGGNIRSRQFYEYGYAGSGWTNPTFTRPGGVRVMLAQIVNLGTSASELMLSVTKVNADVCAAINKLNNITAEDVRADLGGNPTNFTGDTRAALAVTNTYVYGNTYPVIAGKKFFCTTNDRNAIYVLEVR